MLYHTLNFLYSYEGGGLVLKCNKKKVEEQRRFCSSFSWSLLHLQVYFEVGILHPVRVSPSLPWRQLSVGDIKSDVVFKDGGVDARELGDEWGRGAAVEHV